METYPRMREKADSLIVEFAPGMEESSRQPIRMVLDFDQWSEVTGIEILHLVFDLGENCLDAVRNSVPTEREGIRYAYDDASDAFYLKLRAGKSWDQEAADGCVFLDNRGAIIALRVDWRR